MGNGARHLRVVGLEAAVMASARGLHFVGMVFALCAPAWLHAQTAPARWPERPVRFIVPSTPAGPTDILVRLLAEHLTQSLRQQVHSAH